MTTTLNRNDYCSKLGQDFYPDFEGVPTIEAFLDDDEPLESSTVFAHYFAPNFDFWLQALDTETGIAFGLVRGAEREFGSVDLKELCTANFEGFGIEREVDMNSAFRTFMMPKPLSEFATGFNDPSNGDVRWF